MNTGVDASKERAVASAAKLGDATLVIDRSRLPITSPRFRNASAFPLAP